MLLRVQISNYHYKMKVPQELTVVGVNKSPFPTDVIKSAVDICEFWLSLEKSELFDIPSLNSNFIVNKNTR